MRLVTARIGGRTALLVESDTGRHVVRDRDGEAYADVEAWLTAGSQGAQAAQRALDSPVVSDPAVILRPVLAPSAVFCVGLNYRNHILEMGRELPTSPTLFAKLSRALTDPFADLPIPSYSVQLDYEAELAVVIGSGGRDIPLHRAWEAVAGLTVLNDMTLRDWQRRSPQWFAGKNAERLSPVGPALVTADEFVDGISNLRLTLMVNGELRQDARLGDLVFGVPELIADVSQIVQLRPGDIIATGTPGGVAAGADDPQWLRPGDVVETVIERIGTLRNLVVG